MSDFHTATSVPMWRLLLYGAAALAVAGWISHHQDDRRLFIGAAIGVPLVMVLILTAFRFGRSPAAQRHSGTIIWVYILSQVALAIWSLFDHYRHP